MLISPFKIKQFNISSTWVYNVPTNTDCTICRCNLSTPSIYNQEKGIDSYVVSGDCLHSFHQECIKPWVDKNKSCPICSKNWNYSKKPTDDQILSSKNMKINFDKKLDSIKDSSGYKTVIDSSGYKNIIAISDKNKEDNLNNIKNYEKIKIQMNKNLYKNITDSSGNIIDSSGNITDSTSNNFSDSSNYKMFIINKILNETYGDSSSNQITNDNSGNQINININDEFIKLPKQAVDSNGIPKIIKIVKNVKDAKDEVKDAKELKDEKYSMVNMKDLWKEKKVEQLKYHMKMKYKDSDKKIDDSLEYKSVKEYIDDSLKESIEKKYAKDYIYDKTKKINIINKSSESTTDVKKLYIDKMITMFKQNVNDNKIDTPPPAWDSDSEDNASTDDGKNEEDY